MRKHAKLLAALLALAMLTAPLASCKPSNDEKAPETIRVDDVPGTDETDGEDTDLPLENSSDYDETESSPESELSTDSDTTPETESMPETESTPESELPPEPESVVDAETLPNHSFGKWVTVIEPTCYEEGLAEHTCEECGEKETDIIPPTGEHVFGDWTVVVEPTCWDVGIQERYCVCGEAESDVVASPGHSFGEWYQVDGFDCDSIKSWERACHCGEIETQTTEAGHDYASTVTPPTKTTDGYTTHVCTVCGDTYVDSTTYAIGSSGLAYEVNVDGTTCTVIGIGDCTDTQLYIPSEIDGYTVNAIGEHAFLNCIGLTEVTIPVAVKSVGDQIFSGCSNLHTVCFKGSSVRYSSPFLDEPSITKVVFGGTAVPAVIKGLTNITEVVIQDRVRSVTSSAFEGCTGLTKVHITDIAAWCNISFPSFASNPLYYAHDLYVNGELVNVLYIPEGVTSIRNFAFAGCSMSYVYFPEGITSVGQATFNSCKKLKEVTVPEGITVIHGLFNGCTSLERVTLPDSLREIKGSFESCSSLTEIVIPDGVTTISSFAFEYCSSLRSVTLPDSLQSIGTLAFGYCSSLDSITIPASVTEIGDAAFYNCRFANGVTFENPVGWTATDKFDSTVYYAFSPDELTNPSTAASYLHGPYSTRIWTRS